MLAARIAKRLARSNVRLLCVISGPSGSGKTTLLKALSEEFPAIEFRDLDEFDNEVVDILDLPSKQSKSWSAADGKLLFEKRQQLMDDVIENSDKSLVFGGIPFEDDKELRFPSETKKFLLGVDAKTSAMRAYKRSQTEGPNSRRKLSELPLDEQDAQADIDRLLKSGYEYASEDQIRDFLSRNG